MRPSSEGSLSTLFDALPPATLREAVLVVVSTRPVNLLEEAERSERLSGASARGLMGRVVLLDASNDELAEFIQFPDDLPMNRARPGASSRRISPTQVLQDSDHEEVEALKEGLPQ